MRRLVVLLLAIACSAPPKATPPPPLPPQQIDAAVAAVADAAPAAVDAAVATPAPAKAYRTAQSRYGEKDENGATGKTFMVASEDALAAKVGRDVLAGGGNAVDAAVSVAFALAVTRPTAGNLGGGGFAVIRTAKRKVDAIDFREVAPAAATADMYKDHPEDSLVGPRAAGVPGSVAGLWAMHKKYGKKKWKDLLAPAVALAKNGYPVTPYLAKALVYRQKVRPTLTGEFAARFFPDGKPLAVGATVTNPELAVVLERIAAKGPDGFYKGDTAKAIAAGMKEAGGIITEKDLAAYKVQWRKPITYDYRGKWIATMPPPSSGGVVLAMTANMLRDVDLAKLGWHSAAHVHWVVEAWRRAFAARNEALADPGFKKNMPVAKLTSKDEADRLKKTITARATPSSDVPAMIEGTNTTNFSVVDGKGMAVALTTTLNTSLGSMYMISGILMNNEMDDFATRPGQPNVFGLVQGEANKIEPGKRPLSSMSPTIVEDDKGVFMVVGAQGGPRIITSIWQVLSNVIDFGLPVVAAIAAPRFHHQHLPDDVVVEDESLTKETDDELEALGYKRVWGQWDRIIAGANAIVRSDAGWSGAVDPRSGDGLAVGDP